MNWDRLTRTIDTPDTPITDHTLSGKYTAIPPPKELDDKVHTSSEISAAPVRYSQQDISNAPSQSLNEEEEEEEEESSSAVGTKRCSSSDDEGTSSAVKIPKVETFRQKEKRKRDMGMSSRGKNFVEEEKRVLREQFNKH